MKTGDFAEVTRRFSPDDVAAYEALGGAPAVSDELPEPLICALFSYLLGVKLPGVGTNYLKQECDYLAPARVEDTLIRPRTGLCGGRGRAGWLSSAVCPCHPALGKRRDHL